MAKSESTHKPPRESTKNSSPTTIILTKKDPLDTIVQSTHNQNVCHHLNAPYRAAKEACFNSKVSRLTNIFVY